MFVGLITFGASVSVYDLTQSGKAVCDVIAGNHSLEVDAMQVSCHFRELKLSIPKHALSLLSPMIDGQASPSLTRSDSSCLSRRASPFFPCASCLVAAWSLLMDLLRCLL